MKSFSSGNSEAGPAVAASPAAMADAIRFLAIDAIVQAQEGHQGVPLGMAEIATALYTRHLKFDPQDPAWPDRDRVVLSNGHGSMLLYALLHLTGYAAFPVEEIRRFREFGSACEGHPEFDPAKGIETTTGPLGQGIASAFGMAVAEAHLNARFGSALVDHRTYAFVGDGCLQEGVGQEMISLAGHLQLGKLTLLWDDNRITDDGSTDLSISENVAERCRVAGWHVVEVDGHDVEAVSDALAESRQDDRPSFIACRTIIARGLPRLEGRRGGHSARLHPADAEAARERLGWPHPPFHVPDEIARAWRAAGRRGADARAAWQVRRQALPAAGRLEFERVLQGRLPSGWREVLRRHRETAWNAAPVAGITLSAEINDLLTDVLPERMVGCADLEAPTDHKRRLRAFSAQDRSGAYVHCGVREHLMGAMANGMAAHGGVVPLAVTYLAFSDYERPAMRLAALMGLPVKFVFSHDSIGIGKNGPTHQPVEILAALRALPNMLVLRPADAVEAAECWEIALEHRTGPVSLVFARQALPLVRGESPVDENPCRRGGYVLAQAVGGPRQVTLLASGSEVALALQARTRLQSAGIRAAVVSMPSFELFDAQEAAYRRTVLGPGTVRVAVEAAVRFGWDRYLGEEGDFVGMASFGASGPAELLYRHFGITAEAVAGKATRLLEARRTARPGAPAA